MALSSKPVPRNLTKGPYQVEARDINGSSSTTATTVSPPKVPLDSVKDKDGLLEKDKDGLTTKVLCGLRIP